MPHIHELYDFTASAFVLHPTEPKLLLLMHKKLNKWLQPGGHIELDEDPIEGLAHELTEETGLVLGNCTIIEPAEQPKVRGSKTLPLPFHLNVHGFDEKHKHIDLAYVVRANTDKITPQAGESQQFGWFNIAQITEMNTNKTLHDGTLDICKWVLDNHM